jgi:hypothetical protein
MTTNGWLQIIIFLAVIFAITKPLGIFMSRVFRGEKTLFDFALRPIERLLYRVTGVDEKHEMRWTEYASSMLLFSAASMLLLYLIERVQQWMPLWNPQKLAGVPPALAFNTAASFTTNTNWQNYSGEAVMSYFTQMAGLAYHNFVSAAVGLALAIAFVRGIARTEKETIGNFWVDMTRSTLWVLLHRLRAAAGCAGRDSKPPSLRLCKVDRIAAGPEERTGRQANHRRGWQAVNGHRYRSDDCPRSSCFAGSDQDAGHERRRILQR